MVVGEALFRKRLGRAAPWVGGVAALLPDLDGPVIRVFGDAFDYLQHHRGLSHSVVALPVVAVVVAVVAYLVLRRQRSLPWLMLCALAGAACQPALDVPTTWGTMLLEPWSSERIAVDWIFIIDPYLALILAITLVVTWVRLRRDGVETDDPDVRPRWQTSALRGLAMAALYLLALGAFHHVAMDKLNRELAERGLSRDDVQSMACLPVPLVPMAWHAVYTTGDGRAVRSGLLWIMRESATSFDTFAGAADSPAIRAVRATREGGIYFRFARFPVVTERRLDDGDTLVEATDLRFRMWLPGAGWLGRRPFVMRAVVAPDGETVRSVTLGSGSD
jgi:inner membrane protein